MGASSPTMPWPAFAKLKLADAAAIAVYRWSLPPPGGK
jgi:hypothetical protein